LRRLLPVEARLLKPAYEQAADSGVRERMLA